MTCPHCGKGLVLKSFNAVRERRSACGFRFCRSEDDYCSGERFFGLMLGKTI